MIEKDHLPREVELDPAFDPTYIEKSWIIGVIKKEGGEMELFKDEGETAIYYDIDDAKHDADMIIENGFRHGVIIYERARYMVAKLYEGKQEWRPEGSEINLTVPMKPLGEIEE